MKTSIGHYMALLLAGLLAISTSVAQTAKPLDGIYALYNHAVDQHSIVHAFQFPLSTGNDPETSAVINQATEVPKSGWQGCAALAVDRKNQQFYMAEKHRAESGLWVRDRSGGQRLATSGHRNLRNAFVAKMATGPDGHVYAISTSLCGGQTPQGKALLIRFRNGKSTPEILGPLVSRDFDPNTITYSGDIVFSAAGDLFIFGTEVDTVLHAYKSAHILRIPAGRIQQAAVLHRIPVDYVAAITGMGNEPGMDSTILTGVAFDNKGHFILSATDKQTERETYFFKGRIRHRETLVYAMPSLAGIPPGYVASDLASAYFPTLTILPAPTSSNAIALEKSTASWEQYVTIRTYQF